MTVLHQTFWSSGSCDIFAPSFTMSLNLRYRGCIVDLRWGWAPHNLFFSASWLVVDSVIISNWSKRRSFAKHILMNRKSLLGSFIKEPLPKTKVLTMIYIGKIYTYTYINIFTKCVYKYVGFEGVQRSFFLCVNVHVCSCVCQGLCVCVCMYVEGKGHNQLWFLKQCPTWFYCFFLPYLFKL